MFMEHLNNRNRLDEVQVVKLIAVYRIKDIK